MLDRDLASLYGVEVKQLNRQVKRNMERFPADFMFQLSKEDCLRCQIGTIKKGRGEHLKYLPYAFTENGIAMLSSVLRSPTAIEVNIRINLTNADVEDIIANENTLRLVRDKYTKPTDMANFKSALRKYVRFLNSDFSKQQEDTAPEVAAAVGFSFAIHNAARVPRPPVPANHWRRVPPIATRRGRLGYDGWANS